MSALFPALSFASPCLNISSIFEIFFEISVKEFSEAEAVIIFFDSNREMVKVKREKIGEISQEEKFNYRKVIEIPLNTGGRG